MMKMKDEIEKKLDGLIEDAQRVVDETIVEKSGKQKVLWGELEETQMRNLLEIALSVDSPKVLEVFIQYQMGRKKIPKEFGEKLIEEKINSYLKKIAEEISNNTGIEDKEIWIELIKQYLGYLNRYFIYRAKTSKEA